MRSKINFRCVIAYLLSASTIFFLGCPKPPPLTGPTQDALATIFKLKYKSENAVAAGKERFKKNSEGLRKLERLYGDAEAAGNSFIDKVELNLTAKTLQEADLKPQAEETVKAVEELEKYAYAPTRGAVTPIAIADIISGLTKSGLDIWKETRNQEDSVIEKTKGELEKRKWKNYGDLKP
jgi:hypothetical protein